jgi:hypothetical protein
MCLSVAELRNAGVEIIHYSTPLLFAAQSAMEDAASEIFTQWWSLAESLKGLRVGVKGVCFAADRAVGGNVFEQSFSHCHFGPTRSLSIEARCGALAKKMAVTIAEHEQRRTVRQRQVCELPGVLPLVIGN